MTAKQRQKRGQYFNQKNGAGYGLRVLLCRQVVGKLSAEMKAE
jgi:hypothetical protein